MDLHIVQVEFKLKTTASFFQNEECRNEIYSLPWYNMSLNYRKLVYIFLCQVHKPLKFYSFKTNKVGLDSFVQAWKVMYSFINILRVTLHPK